MIFQTWNHGKNKIKWKAILLLAYIADVSCLTNRSFYMRTMSIKPGVHLSKIGHRDIINAK